MHIPNPNHRMGYTESYLFNWMKSVDFDINTFIIWMNGQTVGVSESGETVYYYNDVVKYFTGIGF